MQDIDFISYICATTIRAANTNDPVSKLGAVAVEGIGQQPPEIF